METYQKLQNGNLLITTTSEVVAADGTTLPISNSTEIQSYDLETAYTNQISQKLGVQDAIDLSVKRMTTLGYTFNVDGTFNKPVVAQPSPAIN